MNDYLNYQDEIYDELVSEFGNKITVNYHDANVSDMKNQQADHKLKCEVNHTDTTACRLDKPAELCGVGRVLRHCYKKP